MLRSTMIVLLLLPSVPACSAAEEKNTIETKCQRTVSWGEGDLYEWVSEQHGLVTVSNEPFTATVWQWKDTGLESLATHTLEYLPLSLSFPSRSSIMCSYFDMKAKKAAFLMTHGDDSEPTVWYADEQWAHHISHSNRDGSRVVIWASPDVRNPRHGENISRVGLLNTCDREIEWFAEVSSEDGVLSSPRITSGRLSDDGMAIALAGVRDGIALVDTKAKAVRWMCQPEGEPGLVDIVFSFDGKSIYTGGVGGSVVVIRASDGRITAKWPVTLSPVSRNTDRSYRITALAASPDGRFVAAGVGTPGLVFLFSTADGSLIRVYGHGDRAVLSVTFSPDSTRLASLAGNKIKTWAMPQNFNRDTDSHKGHAN